MSMSKELEDFVNAFGAMTKAIPSKSDRAEQKARTDYYNAQAANVNNPLDNAYKQAQIDEATARTAQIGKPAPKSAIDTANTQSEIDSRDAQTYKTLHPDASDAAGITGLASSVYGQGDSATPAPTQGVPVNPPAAAPGPAATPPKQAVPTGQPTSALPYAATPGSVPTGAAAAVTAQATGQPITPTRTAYRNSISTIESGGDYNLLGPKQKNGDYAVGKYQVMASNVGDWTQEVLGKRMTAADFRANPKAQDAVFDAKFGQFVQKTGNPSDAASIWFTGRPLAQAKGAKDSLGTTAESYVDQFNHNLSNQELNDGHNAVKNGLLTAASDAGVGKSAVPDPASTATRKYINGDGAAPAPLMDQVLKIVDPKGTMPESERNLRALGVVYDYYASHGDKDKADKAAASMVQYYRVASQRYAAFAAAAAQAGDLDTATKAIVKAYANVPDGKDLKIIKTDDGKYSFQFTDVGTGKVMQKGILSPQEIGAMAMRVSPQDFDNFILGAAGERVAAKAEPPPPSYTEVSKANDDVKGAFDAAGIKPSDFTDPKDASTAASVSSHIYTYEANRKNGVTPEDSVAAMQTIIAVDPQNPYSLGTDAQHPGGAPFKATPSKDGKDYTVKFDNGAEIAIPAAQFNQLMAIRKRDQKLAQDKIDKGGADSATANANRDDLNAKGGAAWTSIIQRGKAAVDSMVNRPASPPGASRNQSALPSVVPPGAPLNQSGLPSVAPQRSSPRDRRAVPLP